MCRYGAPETSIHLFLCVTCIPLWYFVIQTLNPLVKYTSIYELFLPTKQYNHRRFTNTFVFATMNKIWRARNNKIFEEEDIPKILAEIKSEVKYSFNQLFLSYTDATSMLRFFKSFRPIIQETPNYNLTYSF